MSESTIIKLVLVLTGFALFLAIAVIVTVVAIVRQKRKGGAI
jgi:hypothetical protein